MANMADYTVTFRVTSTEGADPDLYAWGQEGLSVLPDLIDAFVGELTRSAGGGFEILSTTLASEPVAA